MGISANSAQSEPIVSDAHIRSVLRKEIKRAYVRKETTRLELAHDSGVNVHQIDQIMCETPEKQRRVSLADALSIAWVLGERAVNALLASIRYTAKPLDDADEPQPMQDVAKVMGSFNTFVQAAADGRIDHTEAAPVREATDAIIATLIPYSSHGDAK